MIDEAIDNYKSMYDENHKYIEKDDSLDADSQSLSGNMGRNSQEETKDSPARN